MKKNYFLKTRMVLFLWCFMLVFAFNLHAQTNATLNAVLSGKVNSANVLTNGDITNIASTADRGYVKFDLTSIPVGAVITSARLELGAISPSTSSPSTANKITTTTLDAATAGAGFFAALNTATAAFTGSFAFTTLPNTFNLILNAAGITALNTALGAGQITYGVIRGSTNIYTFAGYTITTFANQPQLHYTYEVPCSGTPAVGTASGPAFACIGSDFDLSLPFSFATTGVTYQWQSSSDGITYSNIGSPMPFPYKTVSQTANTFYRCVVKCTSSGLSAISNAINIPMSTPTYATIPYLETFENSWINGCTTKDIVSNSWRNNPETGNNSWRRQDEGLTAHWSLPGTAYSIIPPYGTFGVARFHSLSALNGTTGTYDLYVDLSTTSAVSLGFNYQNASGTDKLEVLLSTDGGVTFGPVLGTYTTGSWFSQTLNLGVVGSATSVIRFKATSDFGDDDIGIDNVKVDLTPSCTAPNALTVIPTSPTAATVSWNCIACTGSFIVEYGPAGFTPGTAASPGVGGTIASLTATSPFNLTGLSSTSVTDVYVRQDCGSSDYSLNETFPKFIPGDVCENAIDLATLTSPFNGTTSGANNNFTNSCTPFPLPCPDLIYSIEVPDLYTLVIGQTLNGYNSLNTLYYGGACPGTTQITCFNDPDLQSTTWQNTTGSTQTVYWVQDGGGYAFYNGTFRLEWTLTAPAACPQPTGINITGLSTSGATINWNCASCSGIYTVEYGPAGFTPGSGTSLTSSLTSVTISGLTIGTNYEFYVTQDCSSSSNGFSTVGGPYPFSTPRIYGDAVCESIPLIFGVNGPYDNTAATSEAGEPFPGSGACNSQLTWCGFGINNTMWFTFVAPASGRVKIQAPGFDTQLALWSAPNCSSIVTGGATLIAANDDASSVFPFNSAVLTQANCLTPGLTYYLQLDGNTNLVDTTSIILTDLGVANTSFTVLSSTYCIGAPAVTLTPATSGGVFSGCELIGDIIFSPFIAGVGSHSITYTLPGGCYSSSQLVTVQDCTGINENTTSQEVFVYPNPTNGSFRIEMNNITFHELAIKIVDIQGKEVFSSLEKNVKGTYTKQLNLEAIPKGMYFIILSSGSEIKTQKLIIQ